MKNKNIFLYILLTFFMLFLAISPNLKADIENNSLESAQKLADEGIIQNNSGNPEEYNLKNSISRREMLKVMLNIAGVNVNSSCEGKFADISPDDWGCKYAETALNLGYIAGNKYFRPDDNVSKAESLKMLFKATGIEAEKTDDWRIGYVNKAYELGYTDKFYDYDNASLRSFVFNVGAKVIDKNKNSNDLMCLQVITPAINTETGECVNFPNSCIPDGFEKANKCEESELNYKKPKLMFAFNDEMNQTSVLSNLKVYPEINYTSSWSEDDKTLELTLNDLIDKELDVLVNVMDKATTKSGEKLEKTITKKYKIDGNAVVDFVSPEGQLTDTNKNITVRFSKPIVSLTNLDNQEKCPITITPELSGKCVWITTSTFQFRPEKGFPAGARYTVFIPSGIETIAGDKTISSKAFEIVTPAFEIKNYPSNELNKDDKLNFLFNDEVSLSDFRNNFSITGIDKTKLAFEYLQVPTTVSGSYDANKNGISVFPTSGDFGYNKNYSYRIESNMTSSRGNIGLEKGVSANITTNDFLISSNPIVLANNDLEDKYLESNFKYSNNKNIVTKKDPKIVFTFNEEISLNKSLFSLDFPFELNYVKRNEYSEGETKIKEDKKRVVMSINGTVGNNLKITLNTSKVSSSDNKTITFNTKEDNKIINYKQVNYKKACLETQNELGYPINTKAFEFDKYGKVNYISKIQSYSRDDDCKHENGKNKYIVQMNLNPENNYKLTIKNTLLDQDNYPLDKDYNYSFTTGKALNEDKHISIIDGRNNILVPKSINPLSISLTSTNLSKAQVKVCQGDFRIENISGMENETCETKTINIKNLGFKPNISVIDLTSIFGKDFEKNYVSVEVEKLSEDKTDYEKKDNYYFSKASYIFSNVSATIKSGSESLLWLRDYATGENLNDQVEKIQAYKYENEYSIFGQYEGQKYSFVKNLNFSFIKDGTYKITGNDFQTLLITLKSGDKVLLGNIYNYKDYNENIYTYLSTDKPVYKAGEEVNIKGVSRILKATNYELNSGTINVRINDSKYKEIYNKEVKLDNNGSFEVKLDLKDDTSLGNYNIFAGNNSLSFAVEEYEKPDFKVETKSQKEDYLMNENALVDITGEYYIGMPVSAGEGSYTVTSSKYYFDGGKTSGYIWGENNYVWWRDFYQNDYNSTYKNGNFVLNDEGKYTLSIELEDDANEDKIYNVSTTITDPNTKKSISSNTSFIGARSKTFLGMKFDKYYYDFKDTANIGFVATDIEGNKKSNTNFNFKVYKINYKEIPGTYSIDKEEKLVKEESLTTDNSGLANIDFTFDNYGEYRFEIETKDSKYKTTKTTYVSGGDILRPKEIEHKVEVNSKKETYDVGETGEVVISSPVKGVKALFTIEKLNKVLYSQIIDLNDYSNRFNFPIKKEYLPNFDVGVYIIKDSKLSAEDLIKLKDLRTQMLELEQELQTENENIVIPYLIYDLTIFPAPENEDLDKDKLTKLAELRFEEQEIMGNILPEYYIGSKTLKVNTDNVKLNIKAKLDKTSYLPGDKQTINLEVTDDYGNPISGELTLKIIDESLLALKNNSSDILKYFYGDVSNNVNTIGNLENIIKRIDFTQEEINNEVQETDGNQMFGLGGAMEETKAVMDDMAYDMDESMMEKSANSIAPESARGQEDNSTKVRTEFKDLAFYEGSVKVENGKAQIVVDKLPDNVTTWVVSGFAVTPDTKVGSLETDFKVQKDLSILPQIPRFFVDGDISNIGGLIVNNTSTDKQVKVDLNITNATSNENSKTINVKANSSTLVEFKTEIKLENKQNISQANITLTATEVLSPELSRYPLVDKIVLEKPIYKENSGEYVFTNGSTEDLSYEEKINLPTYLDNDGYLEISLGASILTNLLQNLDQILTFPSEDLYSKINFLETSETLEDIFTNAGKKSDFENITLTDIDGKTYSVLEVESLVKSDIKNYLQDDSGLSYFKNCVTSYYYPSCSNFRVTGEFLKLGIEVPGVNNKDLIKYYKEELTQRITENKANGILKTDISTFIPLAVHKETSYIENNLNIGEKLSNLEKLEYIKLYNLLGKAGSRQEEFLKDLRNSLLIEARGTFLPSGNNYNNSYSTALMLEILIQKNEGDKLETENLAKWLLSHRNEDGAYYINNVNQILKSLNLYIEKYEDLENVSFRGKAFLNSKEIMSSNFGENNKFQIDNKKITLEGNVTFGQDNSLGFEKTGTGKLYYDVGVRYFLPTSKLEPRDEGLIVSRNYYDYDEYKNAFQKNCFYPWWGSYRNGSFCTTTKVKNIDTISSSEKGNMIVGEIELIVNQERTNVVVKDFLPAGAEILNTNFDTTSSEAKDISGNNSDYWYNGFDYVEQKDDMVYLYASHLSPGTYKYTYVLNASYSGIYSLKPAVAELIDKPEIWGRSKGSEFEIE